MSCCLRKMSWFRFYKLYSVWITLATCWMQSDWRFDNCFCYHDSAKSDYVAELQTSKSILSHLHLDEASNRVCVPLSNSSSFSLASESLSCSSLRIVLMCCSLIRRFIRMQVASCCINKSSCLSSPHDMTTLSQPQLANESWQAWFILTQACGTEKGFHPCHQEATLAYPFQVHSSLALQFPASQHGSSSEILDGTWWYLMT